MPKFHEFLLRGLVVRFRRKARYSPYYVAKRCFVMHECKLQPRHLNCVIDKTVDRDFRDVYSEGAGG